MRKSARWKTLRSEARLVPWTISTLAVGVLHQHGPRPWLVLAALLFLPSIPPATAAKAPASTAKVFELHGPGQPLWRRWADLDGDGMLDLVVVSGSASGSLENEEVRVETLVAYLQVTPFFLDRRQVLIYRQTAEGFVPWGEPLPLTGDTAAVDLADLDGDGRPEILYAAGYRLFAFERKEGDASYRTTPHALGDVEMLLGYTRSFIPGARLTATLSAAARPSLLLTTPTGLDVRRLGPDGSLNASPDFVLRSGFRSVRPTGGGTYVYEPHPRILDADGDGTLDIFFQNGIDAVVYKGAGDGTFAKAPLDVDLGDRAGLRWRRLRDGGRARGLIKNPQLEDIDGDGVLDIVGTEGGEIDDDDQTDPELSGAEEKAGADDDEDTEEGEAGAGAAPGTGAREGETGADERGAEGGTTGKNTGEGAAGAAPAASGTQASKTASDGPAPGDKTASGGGAEKGADKNTAKKAANPKTIATLTVRHGRPGLNFSEKPEVQVEVERTEKRQGAEIRPEKIDADGRTDLVVTRYAVSLWQVARFLVTKKIAVQVSFESMLQRPDGTFAPSRGKPFESKLTIDLKRGISGMPTSPRGDFNGDKITDLPEFTDSPELRVHLTTRDGVFPSAAAWTVKLPRAPEDRALMDIEDIDGDGRSDVAYFNPEKSGFVTTIVRSR